MNLINHQVYRRISLSIILMRLMKKHSTKIYRSHLSCRSQKKIILTYNLVESNNSSLKSSLEKYAPLQSKIIVIRADLGTQMNYITLSTSEDNTEKKVVEKQTNCRSADLQKSMCYGQQDITQKNNLDVILIESLNEIVIRKKHFKI